MRNYAQYVLLLIVFAAVGCTNWERRAFQALSSSKDAVDSAQAAYEVSASASCPPASATPCIPHTQQAFAAITKAKNAQKTAVDAMVTYETAKAASQGQAALQQAQTDVETALAALPGLISDVKSLYAGGK